MAPDQRRALMPDSEGDQQMKAGFKPGDIVELKSGGLPMTVVDCNLQGVNCQWQDAEGRPQSAIWSEVAVKLSTSFNFDSKLGNKSGAVA